jgi:hypothetical protein
MAGAETHARVARLNRAMARAERAITQQRLLIDRLNSQGAPPDMLARADSGLQRLDRGLAELQISRNALVLSEPAD